MLLKIVEHRKPTKNYVLNLSYLNFMENWKFLYVTHDVDRARGCRGGGVGEVALEIFLAKSPVKLF